MLSLCIVDENLWKTYFDGTIPTTIKYKTKNPDINTKKVLVYQSSFSTLASGCIEIKSNEQTLLVSNQFLDITKSATGGSVYISGGECIQSKQCGINSSISSGYGQFCLCYCGGDSMLNKFFDSSISMSENSSINRTVCLMKGNISSISLNLSYNSGLAETIHLSTSSNEALVKFCHFASNINKNQLTKHDLVNSCFSFCSYFNNSCYSLIDSANSNGCISDSCFKQNNSTAIYRAYGNSRAQLIRISLIDNIASYTVQASNNATFESLSFTTDNFDLIIPFFFNPCEARDMYHVNCQTNNCPYFRVQMPMISVFISILI